MSTAPRDSVARLLVRVFSNQRASLRRYCPRCCGERDFASSGKFRVNAQKKTIDAWLIFRCTSCDTRWNLPVHERRPVAAIDPAELQALMRNDAALAARYAGAHTASTDVVFALSWATALDPDTAAIEMAITVEPACRMRLDRLLASILSLGRDEIERLHEGATLSIAPASRKALRRPAADGLIVRLDLAASSGELAARCRKRLADARNQPAISRSNTGSRSSTSTSRLPPITQIRVATARTKARS